MSANVLMLQQLLERRYPNAVPITRRTAGAITTGIAPFDRALPGGGLPRGRLTAWAPGNGATAVLHAACTRTTSQGERAAWIDGAGTVTGKGWGAGPVLVRPQSARQALESAEELLRCGGIALVVLCGTPTEDAERVRLTRAAREGGAALVILNGNGFLAGVRISTRILPAEYRWRRNIHGEPAEIESVTVRAHISASGWNREAGFTLPIARHELRLSLESGLGDRRGGAR